MIAKEITADQRTEEWFAGRLGRATGSKFACVMSKGRNGTESSLRKNYRAQLVTERLTGKMVESYQSAEMQWGTETEPLARLKYTLATGNEVTECGFFAHQEIMTGASPDGLIGDDGVLEIKCPNTATHIETLKKQSLPTQYYWQVVGEMWITGRKWCDFVSYDPRMPENAAIFIKRIKRNEEEVQKLKDEVNKFLKTVDDEVKFIRKYQN